MKLIPKYIIQLLKFYKTDPKILFKKIIFMFVLHLIKMEKLIKNINFILEKNGTHMTYFVASHLLEKHPERVDIFRNSDHIALPHGYKHLNLRYLTDTLASREIFKAKQIFEKFDLQSWCFRAPYATNTIGDNGIDKYYRFLKQANYSYSSSVFQDEPPWKPINYLIPEFVMAVPSDDSLIDRKGVWNTKQIAKECIQSVLKSKGSIIVFDMHPIRMGQSKFINALDALCKFVNKDPNSDLLDFRKAIESYRNGQDKNFVCITGDIDSWTYFDYLRRIIKGRIND